MKIAVIGLGAMGLPMASNLAKTFTVTGFDISPAQITKAESLNCSCVGSAIECVAEADCTLVAVRNQAQLENLLFGEAGIASAMKKGSVLLLTSTIGIEAVKTVEKMLFSYEIDIVDAPVSGGPVRAGEGDLLVVVGASESAYKKALPVLNEMASTLVWVGKEAGQGQALKTVNQLLCGVHIAAAGEALALAGELGLDQEATLKALMGGAAASFMLGDRGPRAIEAYEGKDAEVKSRLDIFVKDMNIVTTAAKSVGMAVPLAAAAEQEFLLGYGNGQGSADDSSVIKVVQPK